MENNEQTAVESPWIKARFVTKEAVLWLIKRIKDIKHKIALNGDNIVVQIDHYDDSTASNFAFQGKSGIKTTTNDDKNAIYIEPDTSTLSTYGGLKAEIDTTTNNLKIGNNFIPDDEYGYVRITFPDNASSGSPAVIRGPEFTFAGGELRVTKFSNEEGALPSQETLINFNKGITIGGKNSETNVFGKSLPIVQGLDTWYMPCWDNTLDDILTAGYSCIAEDSSNYEKNETEANRSLTIPKNGNDDNGKGSYAFEIRNLVDKIYLECEAGNTDSTAEIKVEIQAYGLYNQVIYEESHSFSKQSLSSLQNGEITFGRVESETEQPIVDSKLYPGNIYYTKIIITVTKGKATFTKLNVHQAVKDIGIKVNTSMVVMKHLQVGQHDDYPDFLKSYALTNPNEVDSKTGFIIGKKLFGAVYNDYAEYRQAEGSAGECVIELGNGQMKQSSQRLQAGASIISDTFGFSIGATQTATSPIAVCGRVLAYPAEELSFYQAGDAVCSAPDGKISKMTREEIKEWPDRIIGYVSEIPSYEEWGSDHIKVNGRIWIKIK